MSEAPDLAAIAARAKEQMLSLPNPSPAQPPEREPADRVRVPMTTPQRKLEVDPIPGYYLQWISGQPGRVAQAKRAGFTHALDSEVTINNLSLGGDPAANGNSDLGSIVSVEEKVMGDDGQPQRLYLMKQHLTDYLEDQAIQATRNDQVADSVIGTFNTGAPLSGVEGDTSERYVDKNRTKIPDLFRRKSAKR